MPISGYFDELFAASGDKTAVPDPVQGDGSVSYTQGYGIAYQTDPGSGGLVFPRNQHNQILYDITAAIQNWQQNTVAPFITSTMNGGTPYSYPKNAIVLKSGVLYISNTGSNTDTPPSSKWNVLWGAQTGSFTAGHIAVFADANGTIEDGGAVPAGTITGVTAGTGITGGGTSGTVTVNVGIATTSVRGGVIPDGTIITVDGSGHITVPAATTSTLGVVKPDGTIITDSAGAITVAKASNTAFGVAKVDNTTITASAGVISAVNQIKSWVNFSVSGGVVTIAQSLNVASITRHAAGDYTIAFTTPLSNANYVVTALMSDDFTSNPNTIALYPAAGGGTNPTTGAFRIITMAGGVPFELAGAPICVSVTGT